MAKPPAATGSGFVDDDPALDTVVEIILSGKTRDHPSHNFSKRKQRSGRSGDRGGAGGMMNPCSPNRHVKGACF